MRYIVSKEGIKVDRQKVKAIIDWPRPTSVLEIRSFLGLPSYFSSFVKDFLKITSTRDQFIEEDH